MKNPNTRAGEPRRTVGLRWFAIVFALAYAFAAFLLLLGATGWLGQPHDPLSAAPLMLLGLPWNLLAAQVGANGVAALLLAPTINLAAIYVAVRPRVRDRVGRTG